MKLLYSQPAGNTPHNVAQDTVQLHGHQGTLMALVQLAAHQDFRSFTTKLFWPIVLQQVPVHLAVAPQMQNFAFPLAELYDGKVPLKSILSCPP